VRNGQVITLVIEVSNPGPAGDRASVALIAGADADSPVMVGKTALSARRRHEDALMPAVASLCRQADLNANDLDRIAVSIGPGGFTSVRIATTTAKLIAEVTAAKCLPVPTALALAFGAASRSKQSGQILVLLAWKRDDVWGQRFSGGDCPTPINEPHLIPLNEIATHSKGALLVADAGLVTRLRELKLAEFAGEVVVAEFDPVDVYRASWSVAPTDPLLLLPLYPREPEAVTKWRALHPAVPR